MNKPIRTRKDPAAIGPYSRASFAVKTIPRGALAEIEAVACG